jgi:hypothetical protein
MSKLVRAVLDYQIQLITWMAGIAAIVCGGVYGSRLGSTWQTVVLTLGGTALSAALIGTLLNAVWWLQWTRRAIVALMQDSEMIEGMGLDRARLREKLIRVLCAIYGSTKTQPGLEKLLARDVLERLSYPIRKNYNVTMRLERFPSASYDLSHLIVTVSYRLHYPTEESLASPMFSADSIITQGYVDVPQALLDEWRARMKDKGVTDEVSTDANDILKAIAVDELPVFVLTELYINGVRRDEIERILEVDGAKPDPSVHFQVVFKAAHEKVQVGGETEIRYVYRMVDNVFSYYFLTMRGLTDGLSAHLSFDPAEYKADLRYLLPSYWPPSEKLFTQSHLGEVDLSVSAMMLAGHSLLAAWYAKEVRLSKRKKETWQSDSGQVPGSGRGATVSM